MKTAIGFRVTATEIFYSIVEEKEENFEVISVSSILVPSVLEQPNQLSYIKNLIITMISQYNISLAGLKRIEGNVRNQLNNVMQKRINIEGVIMELISHNNIEKYLLAYASTISSIFKRQNKPAEEIYDDEIDFEILTDLGNVLKKEHKEAIIVAIALLKKGDNNE